MPMAKFPSSVKSAHEKWKEDTDVYLDYDHDRAFTVPKGKSIVDKSYFVLNKVTSRPKGKKIGDYPEAYLENNGDEAIMLITKTHLKSHNKKSLTQNKPKKCVKEANLSFDKEKTKQYAYSNNIKIDSSLPQQETTASTDPNLKTVNKIRDELAKEDAKMHKTTVNTYIRLLDQYKLNETLLLEELTNFPMASKEDILANKSLYTESECQLMDQFLLEKLDESHIRLPSVTKILDFTKSDKKHEALTKWKIEKIQTLGREGFQELNKKTLSEGTKIHGFIEKCLKEIGQNDLECHPTDNRLFSEIQRIVKSDFKDILLIESTVSHKNLFYQGKVDCLAYYNGNLCLIDWKTSEKDKSELRDLYDLPVQVTAY
jgi:genome maintenance exonuclease 1